MNLRGSEPLGRLSLQIGLFLPIRVIIDLGDREEIAKDGLSREDCWKGNYESIE